MERRVQRTIGGAIQECTQYYHRLVAVTIVSTPFPIPLGLRFQKPGEGEVACAAALLQRIPATQPPCISLVNKPLLLLPTSVWEIAA